MGGRGSGGGKSGGGGGASNQSPKPFKLPKGTPYLKNLNDSKEVEALRQKTLKEVNSLMKKTNFYGDKTMQKLKNDLALASHFDGENVLALADTFYNYKPKFLKQIKWFEGGA